MDIHQILEEIAYDFGVLPREAIEAAILYKEQITPFLLDTLKKSSIYVEEIIEQDNYHGHLYAMYLLAQFRNQEAFGLIINLMSFPSDLPHLIFGDVLTEDLSRILASTYNLKHPLLEKLIESPHINEYCQAAAIETYPILVASQIMPRDPVIDYFDYLFTKGLAKKPSVAWASLATSACLLYPDALYQQIHLAYRANLINAEVFSMSQIEKTLASSKENHFEMLANQVELIEDTVSEMEKWLSLNP